MPFLAHIDELRKRLFIIVIVLLVVSAVMYFFSEPVFNLLLHPVRRAIKQIIITNPLEAMSVKFMLSFWSAVILTSPLITWQLMAFFLPALKSRERKWLLPTFAAMVVLFAIGVVFCYQMILPASFQWLIDQSGKVMSPFLKADATVNVIEFFLLGFGIAFQTPIVVFYLVYFGVISYRKLRESWRIIYVVIVILAAAITPDFSPVSMLALAVAMIVLYEVTMLLLRVVLAKRIKAQSDDSIPAAIEAA